MKPLLSFMRQKRETVADMSVRLEQLQVVQLSLSRVRKFGMMVWVVASMPNIKVKITI